MKKTIRFGADGSDLEKARQTTVILLILGTRPEAIKLLPLAQCIRAKGGACRLLMTEQHADLCEAVFDAFGISPDERLPPRRSPSLPRFLSDTVSALAERFEREPPKIAVVQGDTVSAYAGGLTAFLHGIPVAHVEAGLRSHDPFSPYPEEAFRRSLAAMATWHFAPNAIAAQHLIAEGVPGESVFTTGNTVSDALSAFASRLAPRPVEPGTRLILLTVHRRESGEDGYRAIFSAILRLLDRHADLRVLYPLHPTPLVRRVAFDMFRGEARVTLSEPLPLGEFYSALFAADLVMTDSGGVQEEAALLGIPALVLRERTEREAELSDGKITLAGLNAAHIEKTAEEMLAFARKKERISFPPSPSERIADILLQTEQQ